ncbi:MAG: sugar ABC transporter permease [Hungatella sp.]|nr:sugar ABC transporter permease [Hungatella sp.]
MKENTKRKLFPYLLILPSALFLLVFTMYPCIYLVRLSFYEYNLLKPPKWIGWKNYVDLFTRNVDFVVALKNTAIYTAAIVTILILFGLILAVCLQRESRINSFVQRAMFIPHIVGMLSVAMIFQWMFNEKGLFNAVLAIFRLPGLKWLNSSDTALICIIIVAVWKSIGYYALILLSSLKAIPAEINEAALLDDAGPVNRFFHIFMPMLSPQIFFLLVTITINSFKVFESVRQMTKGGPGNSTNVLVYYIYNYAFNYNKYGYAAAAGVVLLLIMIVMTILYFKAMGKRVHYQ